MENNKNQEGLSMTRSNFGPWGWFIIVFAFLSFMFAGNLIVDSLNLTVGAFSELHGWELGALLGWTTVGELIALFGSGILSALAAKYGVKKIYVVSLAVVACCCMVWGNVTSIGQYAVIVILVDIFGNGFGFVGGTAILANWFPRKKGLAMGWATIGFQASSIILLPLYQYLLSHFDLVFAYRVVGICLFVLLFVCIFFVKSNPEERGCAPDNDKSFSIEEFKAMHEKAQALEKKYGLTSRQLLGTKQLWQIGLSNGLVQLAVTVLIVQFIPNMVSVGFSTARATMIYSIAAIIGGVGSYLWGVLDARIGVKKASAWMCIIHAIACVLFGMTAHGIGGSAVAIISAFIIGTILGVSSNYVGSFTATVFGRYGYSSAFAFIIMIVTGLRALGFSLIGVINTATGSNMAAYYIAAGLSVLALIITLRTNDACIDPVVQKQAEAEAAGVELE